MTDSKDIEEFTSYLEPVPEGVVEFTTTHPPLVLDRAVKPRLARDFPPPYRTAQPHWVARYPGMNGQEIKSIKTCPGINDLAKLGYILPLWSDYLLERVDEEGAPDPEGQFIAGQSYNGSFAFYGSAYGIHTHSQIEGTPFEPKARLKDCGCPADERRHMQDLVKPNSPWFIRTAPGWSCLFLDAALWRKPSDGFPLEAVAGVLDTDIWHQTHIPCVWNPGHLKRAMTLKAGTPILHIIPFKRESRGTQLRLRLATNPLHVQQLHTALIHSDAGYRRYQKARDQVEGCPFAAAVNDG